jgi:hypothetical protein
VPGGEGGGSNSGQKHEEKNANYSLIRRYAPHLRGAHSTQRTQRMRSSGPLSMNKRSEVSSSVALGLSEVLSTFSSDLRAGSVSFGSCDVLQNGDSLNNGCVSSLVSQYLVYTSRRWRM